MAEVLHAKIRSDLGKRPNRRLRDQGQIPAVLYGHGEANVHLSVPNDELSAVLRHGAQMVEIAGDLNESALLREVCWDTYGQELIHVDFLRVSAKEKVEVTVPLELRGESPGSKQNGIVESVYHELQVECAANAIPESLTLTINRLELNGTLTVKDVEVPEGVKILLDPEETLVTCQEAVEAPEEEESAIGPVEPEMIGREKNEEEQPQD